MFFEILQNLQENNCARFSFLIKLQAACSSIREETVAFPVNLVKCLRTPILKNWRPASGENWGTGEKCLKQIWHSIKVSGSLLKAFSEQQDYLTVQKLSNSATIKNTPIKSELGKERLLNWCIKVLNVKVKMNMQWKWTLKQQQSVDLISIQYFAFVFQNLSN